MKHFAIIYYSVAYNMNGVVNKYDTHAIKEVPVFTTEDDVKNWLEDLETTLGKNHNFQPADIKVLGVTITNIIKL